MEAQLKDPYKSSRTLYIIEAALEYFVAIAVGSVYLAEITSYMGIPDSVTGILTSFVSLGCGFQVIAIFLAHKRPVKNWVTVGHIISQLLFSALYFVPLLPINMGARAAILIVTLILAQIIHNAINSPKINWFMSLVDEKKRGRFTANKEIISLLGGMVFSFSLGAIMDELSKRNNTRLSFIICGVLLLFLTSLHTLTLVFSKEKEEPRGERIKLSSLAALFKSKALLKVVLVFVLWNIGSNISGSYMGAYQVNDLGFEKIFSSLIIIIGSLVRAIFSKPLGKFADKYSFCKMLYICFAMEGAAFLSAIFITPSNGRVMYIVYYVLYCIGCAGINSSIINLIYDYVPIENRVSALAILNTLAGFAGFFATLSVSPLVSHIQNNNNTVFGMTVYAQQLLSALSLLVVIIIGVYMVSVISKLKRNEE